MNNKENQNKQDWLLEFVVDKEVTVDKPEEREEGGEKVTVTKKVTEKQPVHFYIKNPTRKERTAQESYTAGQFGRLVTKEGAVPRAILEKKFQEEGGLFTKEELEEYRSLLKDLRIVENELFHEESKAEKDLEKIKELQDRVVEIRDKMISYRSYDTGMYSNSADEIAQGRTIRWLVANLMYLKEPGQKEPRQWFASDKKDRDDKLEEQLDYMEAIYTDENQPYVDAIDFASSICTLWLMGYRKQEQLKVYLDNLLQTLFGKNKDRIRVVGHEPVEESKKIEEEVEAFVAQES